MSLLSPVDIPLINFQTGQPLPGATVTVYKTGTNTKASVYDLTGAGIANPIVADATGIVTFQIPVGTVVDVVWTLGAYTSPRIHSGMDISSIIDQINALYTPMASQLPYDKSVDMPTIVGSAIYGQEPYNQSIANRKVIGGFEAWAGEVTNGGDYDLTCMSRGTEFNVDPRRSATQDTVLRLGQGQTFATDGVSNVLTLGKGRSAKIRRLTQLLYMVWIAPLRVPYIYGSWYGVPNEIDSSWTLYYKFTMSVTGSAGTQTLTLPSGWTGLSGTTGLFIKITQGADPTYASGVYAMTYEIVDDTNIKINNPNTTTQLGSTTQVQVEIRGLTYTPSAGAGKVAFSSDPSPGTGMDFTFLGAGQSDMAIPMMTQGPSYMDARVQANTGAKKKIWFVNSAFSGSCLMVGGAPGNEWWNQNTGLPSANATAFLANYNAIISSGAPVPQSAWFDIGQSEALLYGDGVHTYLTVAAWVAAFQAFLSWFRTQISNPTFAFWINPIGRMGLTNGNDVGINVIRQAQLQLCDGVNFLQGADAPRAQLRDGLHYALTGQQEPWNQIGDLYTNKYYATTKKTGPVVTLLSKNTLRQFDITISPSSGSLIVPDDFYWGCLLPTSDPASTPIDLDPSVPPYMVTSTKIRVTTAADQTGSVYLCYPYGSIFEPIMNFITDGSGYPMRFLAMLQST